MGQHRRLSDHYSLHMCQPSQSHPVTHQARGAEIRISASPPSPKSRGELPRALGGGRFLKTPQEHPPFRAVLHNWG